MRGVISGAMLMGLQSLGLKDCFDAGARCCCVLVPHFSWPPAVCPAPSLSLIPPILSLSCPPLTVYGASAGAINATFFISGQPHGLDIYRWEAGQ